MFDDKDPAIRAMVEAAADWRAREDAGLTPAGEQSLLHWLEKDPRHAEIFGEMDAAWTLLDRACEISPAELGVARPRHFWQRTATGWTMAALAATAAAALVFLRLGPMEKIPDRHRETAVAEAGLFRRVDLPDGSVMRLNAETEVAIDYGPDVRRVQLVRGEAHFEVTKNPHRPFVVAVGAVDVRAVGTAFDVALRRTAVEVVVTEGRVRVADRRKGRSLLPARPAAGPRTERLLGAGEQAVIPLSVESTPMDAVVQELPPARVDEVLAWRKRRLEFDAAALSEIVAEFNRFNRHQLVIADRSLAELRFSGSFQADDPDTLVALLQTRLSISITRKPDETVLRATSLHSRP